MLIGTLATPISSAPLVILIYAVLILMLVGALASVLLRSMLYAAGAFAATMLLVAILYLAIAPFTLFVVQLLIFTLASGVIVMWLLRDTSGLGHSAIGPFSREWIVGGAVCAALLALLCAVVGTTGWPVRIGPQGVFSPPVTVLSRLTSQFVVGLATLVILLGSAALGAALVLASGRSVPARSGQGREIQRQRRRA